MTAKIISHHFITRECDLPLKGVVGGLEAFSNLAIASWTRLLDPNASPNPNADPLPTDLSPRIDSDIGILGLLTFRSGSKDRPEGMNRFGPSSLGLGFSRATREAFAGGEIGAGRPGDAVTEGEVTSTDPESELMLGTFQSSRVRTCRATAGNSGVEAQFESPAVCVTLPAFSSCDL